MTKKISCDFCQEKFKREDLIDTPIDECEIVLICENCRAELEANVEY